MSSVSCGHYNCISRAPHPDKQLLCVLVTVSRPQIDPGNTHTSKLCTCCCHNSRAAASSLLCHSHGRCFCVYAYYFYVFTVLCVSWVPAVIGTQNDLKSGVPVVSGRPGGVSGYPRAWYRSVREFEPRRVHTRINLGIFSYAQIDLRKA